VGQKGKKRGREEGLGFSFSSFSFKTLSKLKHFSNSFQIFQNILETFKTSHQHIKTPCTQNMMHKHLLLLKLFKMVFKYFRAKFN
jgi:hypothetical protein